MFAVGGGLGLHLEPGGELAHHQGHHQHHAEGDHVLRIAHRKVEAWRYKKEVKQPHAQKRRQDGGATPQPHRHTHHHQQEQHDDVGQLQHVGQRRGHHGGEAAGEGGGDVAGPESTGGMGCR